MSARLGSGQVIAQRLMDSVTHKKRVENTVIKEAVELKCQVTSVPGL